MLVIKGMGIIPFTIRNVKNAYTEILYLLILEIYTEKMYNT